MLFCEINNLHGFVVLSLGTKLQNHMQKTKKKKNNPSKFRNITYLCIIKPITHEQIANLPNSLYCYFLCFLH